MTDTQLRDEILNQIELALIADGDAPDAQRMQLLEASITTGIGNYRSSTDGAGTQYFTSLGAYIVGQNPYSVRENLVLPNLPLERDGENPWVRKSGVLVKNNIQNPLPRNEPIPAGISVDFPYVDWKDLRVNPGDNLEQAPPSDVPPGGPFPTDDAITYDLNIIKTIRLRYTILNRRYDENDAQAAAANLPSKDVQTGYILIQYSGGNTG